MEGTDALESFAGRLQNDVQSRLPEHQSESQAFAAEVVERLEEHQYLEEAVLTFYEKARTPAGSTRVYGFSVISDDDSTGDNSGSVDVSLITVVPVTAGDTAKVTKSQVTDAGERAFRVWDLACKDFHTGMDPHLEAYAMFERIASVKSRVKTLRVLILTHRIAVTKLDSFMAGDVEVTYDVWDLARLSRLDSDAEEEPIVVDFDEEFTPLPCLAMPAQVADYHTWLAILSGAQVYALYKKYRLRLLERNVRSFLQARGKVNRGIRQTLRNEPSRFLAYNNGLSAIADEVVTERLPDGQEVIKQIVGLQIVNGGQTTASIFHCIDESSKDMFDVFVQLKLTKIAPQSVDEMAPRIAEFANTQNPIRQTDLTSSAPFHIELEKLSRETWTPDRQSKWFYERARGAYENALSQSRTSKKAQKQFEEEWPKAQRFTKAEVAAWMNLWPDRDDPRPYEVSMGGEKNHAKWFKRFVDEADEEVRPDLDFFKRLVARGIVFRAIEKLAKVRIEAHRSNIVAYTLALLVERKEKSLDLDAIWAAQAPPAAIMKWVEERIGKIDEEVRSTAGAKNIGEWCKKPDCWAEVQAAVR